MNKNFSIEKGSQNGRIIWQLFYYYSIWISHIFYSQIDSQMFIYIYITKNSTNKTTDFIQFFQIKSSLVSLFCHRQRKVVASGLYTFSIIEIIYSPYNILFSIITYS